MKRQTLHCARFRSAAGFVLVGPGLFLLAAHVIAVVGEFSRFLNQTASAKLQLVSSIMLAASFNPQRAANLLVATLWPVVLVMMGGAFLRKTPEQKADPCVGCA